MFRLFIIVFIYCYISPVHCFVCKWLFSCLWFLSVDCFCFKGHDDCCLHQSLPDVASRWHPQVKLKCSGSRRSCASETSCWASQQFVIYKLRDTWSVIIINILKCPAEVAVPATPREALIYDWTQSRKQNYYYYYFKVSDLVDNKIENMTSATRTLISFPISKTLVIKSVACV